MEWVRRMKNKWKKSFSFTFSNIILWIIQNKDSFYLFHFRLLALSPFALYFVEEMIFSPSDWKQKEECNKKNETKQSKLITAAVQNRMLKSFALGPKITQLFYQCKETIMNEQCKNRKKKKVLEKLKFEIVSKKLMCKNLEQTENFLLMMRRAYIVVWFELVRQ